MKLRIVLAVLLIGGILTSAGIGAAQSPPPTIFLFSSNIPSVTMADLERGDLTITLGWHVAHVDASHTLRLYAYQGYAWKMLHDPDQGLPAVGNLTVPLEHPGNFNAPTYKLVILSASGDTLDERILVIPYEQTDAAPMVDTFMTETQSIEAAALAGGERVVVTWRVSNRPPLTNLVFEQVEGEDVRNVELPRAMLWVPSAGTGAVVPVQPPNGSVITLRLRLLDVITAHTYAEQTLTISVTGVALPNETEEPTAEPSAAAPTNTDAVTKFGDLLVLDVCLATADSAPQRGWMDGDGIRSPNQQYIAYATNALGDAKIVIANADGSGQIEVDAPDKAFPLWIRPVWSPDSERIAFANIAISQPGGGTIYIAQRDGSDLREIVSYTGYHDDLAWSEDGTLVYFSSGVASGAGSGTQVGDYTIYAVAADGLGAPAVASAGCLVKP